MGRLRLGPALARCLASWLIFRLTKTLRHYLATRFLEKNQGDIATLATVLGHANISTTTRYLHPNARRVQEMVEEM
jgi:site-specific recombinase XerD